MRKSKRRCNAPNSIENMLPSKNTVIWNVLHNRNVISNKEMYNSTTNTYIKCVHFESATESLDDVADYRQKTTIKCCWYEGGGAVGLFCWYSVFLSLQDWPTMVNPSSSSSPSNTDGITSGLGWSGFDIFLNIDNGEVITLWKKIKHKFVIVNAKYYSMYVYMVIFTRV